MPARKDILGSHVPVLERACSLYFWSPDDLEGFGHWLKESRLDLPNKKKILAQLCMYSRHGLPKSNREKFKHIVDKICELKPTAQVRLLGFEDGADFVILCMDIKKTQKLSPAVIEKAQRLWRVYHEHK